MDKIIDKQKLLDKFFDNFIKILKPPQSIIYLALINEADKLNLKSFVITLDELKTKTSIKSSMCLLDHLKKLEDYGLIKIKKSRLRKKRTTYTILNPRKLRIEE